jgi:hypothetical protein
MVGVGVGVGLGVEGTGPRTKGYIKQLCLADGRGRGRGRGWCNGCNGVKAVGVSAVTVKRRSSHFRDRSECRGSMPRQWTQVGGLPFSLYTLSLFRLNPGQPCD